MQVLIVKLHPKDVMEKITVFFLPRGLEAVVSARSMELVFHCALVL